MKSPLAVIKVLTVVTEGMPEKHACPLKACSHNILTNHFASRTAAIDELLARAVGWGESASDQSVKHSMASVGHQGAVTWELQLLPGWVRIIHGVGGEP